MHAVPEEPAGDGGLLTPPEQPEGPRHLAQGTGEAPAAGSGWRAPAVQVGGGPPASGFTWLLNTRQRERGTRVQLAAGAPTRQGPGGSHTDPSPSGLTHSKQPPGRGPETPAPVHFPELPFVPFFSRLPRTPSIFWSRRSTFLKSH